VPAREDPHKLVELMADNEEALARLYRTYAQRFPELADLWSALAEDELTHAEWLRTFAGSIDAALHIDETRFRKEAVSSFGAYVREQTIRAQTQQLPPITALSVARDAERALIERRFFEVFETDSVEMKHQLQRLADSVEEHIRKVEQSWEEYR